MDLHKKTTSFEFERGEMNFSTTEELIAYARNKIQPFLDDMMRDGWAFDTNITYFTEYRPLTGNTMVTAEIIVMKADEPPILSEPQDGAAMWGLAENQALPIQDRLKCALKALEQFGGAVERLEAWCEEREESRIGTIITTRQIREIIRGKR